MYTATLLNKLNKSIILSVSNVATTYPIYIDNVNGLSNIRSQLKAITTHIQSIENEVLRIGEVRGNEIRIFEENFREFLKSQKTLEQDFRTLKKRVSDITKIGETLYGVGLLIYSIYETSKMFGLQPNIIRGNEVTLVDVNGLQKALSNIASKNCSSTLLMSLPLLASGILSANVPAVGLATISIGISCLGGYVASVLSPYQVSETSLPFHTMILLGKDKRKVLELFLSSNGFTTYSRKVVGDPYELDKKASKLVYAVKGGADPTLELLRKALLLNENKIERVNLVNFKKDLFSIRTPRPEILTKLIEVREIPTDQFLKFAQRQVGNLKPVNELSKTPPIVFEKQSQIFKFDSKTILKTPENVVRTNLPVSKNSMIVSNLPHQIFENSQIPFLKTNQIIDLIVLGTTTNLLLERVLELSNVVESLRGQVTGLWTILSRYGIDSTKLSETAKEISQNLDVLNTELEEITNECCYALPRDVPTLEDLRNKSLKRAKLPRSLRGLHIPFHAPNLPSTLLAILSVLSTIYGATLTGLAKALTYLDNTEDDVSKKQD